MVKKMTVILFIMFFASHITISFAKEERMSEAEKKAKEIHGIVSSDVIYANEELKALYYQNIQIIELLKQIRNLLGQQLEETSRRE